MYNLPMLLQPFSNERGARSSYILYLYSYILYLYSAEVCSPNSLLLSSNMMLAVACLWYDACSCMSLIWCLQLHVFGVYTTTMSNYKWITNLRTKAVNWLTNWSAKQWPSNYFWVSWYLILWNWYRPPPSSQRHEALHVFSIRKIFFGAKPTAILGRKVSLSGQYFEYLAKKCDGVKSVFTSLVFGRKHCNESR